jgi:hypothetical protein
MQARDLCYDAYIPVDEDNDISVRGCLSYDVHRYVFATGKPDLQRVGCHKVVFFRNALLLNFR